MRLQERQVAQLLPTQLLDEANMVRNATSSVHADVATIRDGVQVRQLHTPGAGRGLFADRDFAKNTLVTEYSGEILADEFAAAECTVQTHILYVNADRHGQLGSSLYISDDREPIPGRGGGSFANHQDHTKDCSTKFVLVDGKAYLIATRDIAAHEEILVNCGDLQVMMSLRRRICRLDVDGKRTIAFETISLSPWGERDESQSGNVSAPPSLPPSPPTPSPPSPFTARTPPPG
jgi:hypothetical protein